MKNDNNFVKKKLSTIQTLLLGYELSILEIKGSFTLSNKYKLKRMHSFG